MTVRIEPDDDGDHDVLIVIDGDCGVDPAYLKDAAIYLYVAPAAEPDYSE